MCCSVVVVWAAYFGPRIAAKETPLSGLSDTGIKQKQFGFEEKTKHTGSRICTTALFWSHSLP
jgi:hypothetical protein